MSSPEQNHINDHDLHAFATGRLAAQEYERVEQHLLSCEQCGRRIDQFTLHDPFVNHLQQLGIDIPTKDAPHSNSKDSSTIGKPGTTVDKYLLCELLGRGGMGVVFKAHDPVIDRYVALKLLTNIFADVSEAAQRFLREVRSIGRLNHEHVVTIFDVGKEESTFFLVMEWMTGGSVGARILRNGPLDWLEATRVVIQACKGLGAAHNVGIIHRDIKPDNLLISSDNKVKLSDFGLARLLDESSLTGGRQLVGTPNYMSPEQCQGDPVDARSDLYSLGATYYSLLTGKRPYENAQTLTEVFFAHCSKPAPNPRDIRSDIPEPCVAIIFRAMAKQPRDRYSNCETMLSDLFNLVGPLAQDGVKQHPVTRANKVKVPPKTYPRFRWSVAGVFGLLLIGLLVWLLGLFPPWNSGEALEDGKKPNGNATIHGPNYRLAKWALANGATLRITYDTNISKIDLIQPGDKLPEKEFLLNGVAFIHPDASEIKDEDLKKLISLKHLNILSIPKASITNNGLRYLATLPRLRTLKLEDTDISDAGIKHLAGKTLFELHLKGTSITDESVEELKSINGLGILELTDTRISPTGLAKLREQFPKCQIFPKP